MGRSRKIVELATGKIGKAKRAAREAGQKKYKLDRDGLTPPEWLDEEAKEEFTRVVTEAAQVDILDNLDFVFVVIYANAWSRYKKVTERIAIEGDTITRYSRDEEYQALSPLVQAQREYAKQIMQCSAKLGMATTDRLKLVVPVKEENHINKYLKYLEK